MLLSRRLGLLTTTSAAESVAATITTVEVATTATALSTTAVAAPATLSLIAASATTATRVSDLLEALAVGTRGRSGGGNRSLGSGDRGVLSPALGAGRRGRLVDRLGLARVAGNHLKALGQRVIGNRDLGVPLLCTSRVGRGIFDTGGRRHSRLVVSLAVGSGGTGSIELGQASVGDRGVGGRTDRCVRLRRDGLRLSNVFSPSLLFDELGGGFLGGNFLDFGI